MEQTIKVQQNGWPWTERQSGMSTSRLLWNPFETREAGTGNSLYRMMFAAAPNRPLSQCMKKVEYFISNGKEFYHDSNRSARMVDVLPIQSQRTERYSLDLQKPTKPYEIGDLVMMNKTLHASRTPLTTKWMGTSKVFLDTRCHMLVATRTRKKIAKWFSCAPQRKRREWKTGRKKNTQ